MPLRSENYLGSFWVQGEKNKGIISGAVQGVCDLFTRLIYHIPPRDMTWLVRHFVTFYYPG